ncbi:MAG: hypothetical protein JXR63_06700 [Spirochaetales bacterium]|nr:hypothetical protein [Spirochaetales bacterium]
MRKNLFFITFVLFSVSCLGYKHSGDVIDYGAGLQMKPVHIGALSSDLAEESSGLARSFLEPNKFITHNDSFNTNHLFKLTFIPEIDCKCKSVTYSDLFDDDNFRIKGSNNFDWEDLADNKNGTIYIVDSGNNWRFRHFIPVYQVDETADFTLTTKFSFKYPSGSTYGKVCIPVYDNEASYYWNNQLFFITKEKYNSPILFSASLDKRSSTLSYVKNITANIQVTGADISDDGSVLAVLTYTAILLYLTVDGHPADSPFKIMPISLGQAEAICFMANGRLLVTSESKRFGVFDIDDFYTF